MDSNEIDLLVKSEIPLNTVLTQLVTDFTFVNIATIKKIHNDEYIDACLYYKDNMDREVVVTDVRLLKIGTTKCKIFIKPSVGDNVLLLCPRDFVEKLEFERKAAPIEFSQRPYSSVNMCAILIKDESDDNVKTELLIDEDGNISLKTDGNTEVNVEGDTSLSIKGDVTFETEGNCTATVGGDLKVDVDGDSEMTVGGDMKADVTGSCTVSSTGDMTAETSGKLSVSSDGDTSVDVGGNCQVTSSGTCQVTSTGDLSVNSDGDISVSCSGDADVESDGDATIKCQSFSVSLGGIEAFKVGMGL